MILLREVREEDLQALLNLAQIPGFINLPEDPDMMRAKIEASIRSFKEEARERPELKFIFVAEDLETQQVVGTSMIAAQHGTKESPHFYFEVGKEEKFSSTINTGFIHGTLVLKQDTDGPSELGGLVMNSEWRNHSDRIGRQISFVRFMYLGLHRQKFKRKIIAELLPPLNKKGQSPLWEAVGRRFTNMDYWEADKLCQQNKEFIFSLFPTGKIYTTFLSADTRDAIGKVGKDTEPVFHMLTKIGFEYKNHVDPFDGGPHLWADVSEIVPIKKMDLYRFTPALKGGAKVAGLLAPKEQPHGGFRAVAIEAQVENKMLSISSGDEAKNVLGIRDGDSVVFMPYY